MNDIEINRLRHDRSIGFAACVALCVALWSAAAQADAPLAAPGDCAQPREQVVTQPVQAMPAAVAGRASDQFTPTNSGPTADAPSLTDLLGLTSTRPASTSTSTATVQPVEAVRGVLQSTATIVDLTDPVVNPIVDLADPIVQPIVDLSDPIVEPILDPGGPVGQVVDQLPIVGGVL